MAKIKKNIKITEKYIQQLQQDERCYIGSDVVIEEGSSIYFDSDAKFLSIGDGVCISRGAHIEVNAYAEVIIGKNVTIGRNSVVASMLSIKVGEGVGIANGVSIRDHNHRINSKENLENSCEMTPWASGFECAPIVIENMAILSDNVRVLPGVRVGQNCFIGAGVHLRETLAPNQKIVGDAKDFKIIDKFYAPMTNTTPRELVFNFFGDSLIDRPSIVVDDPHYDLPKAGELVPVNDHETAGFFKIIHQFLQVKYPEQKFIFQSFAEGGSNIRNVQEQVRLCSEKNNFWDVSVVCTGINDIWRKYQNREQDAVSLDEYLSIYENTIKKLKTNSRLVFCIGEPIVNGVENADSINKELQEYNDNLKRICDKHDNAFYIDLYSAFKNLHLVMSAYNPQENLWIDGVHLSPIGNMFAALKITEKMEHTSIKKAIFRLNCIERKTAISVYCG